jgi:hypothetical protein
VQFDRSGGNVNSFFAFLLENRSFSILIGYVNGEKPRRAAPAAAYRHIQGMSMAGWASWSEAVWL